MSCAKCKDSIYFCMECSKMEDMKTLREQVGFGVYAFNSLMERNKKLETLLQEITKELLEFSSNGKIENIRSRIREILGE